MSIMLLFKKLSKTCICLSVLSALSWPTMVTAKDYFVENKQAYNKIAGQLTAGDNVVLKNGTWQDFKILFSGKGTKANPITLTAETKGQVILSGQSNLRLAGEYLVVSGLVFKHGYTPSSSVIEFRKNKDNLAYHSRVTEVVIDNYNNPDKQESDYWVAFYGQHNRLDHSYLAGKRNKGVTVAVRLNSENSQQNYHQIDHNYFGPRPTFGSNGGETLRIGTSHYSLTDSFTLVSHNYFERCNGEVEIISVKSGKNQLRNNVFFESRGTLTLRHGNGNLVEENIFLGNGVDHTGGIRVINKDQIVRNNYLSGLTGYRFGSGFTVMNGVPNSPINRYHQVDNALIENNTFVDVEHIHLGAGSDKERSAAPINSIFKNNLVLTTSAKNKQDPFSIFDDIDGIRFTGNISNTNINKQISNGFEIKPNIPILQSKGLLTLSGQWPAGVKDDLKILNKAETGPKWYAKKQQEVAFDSGNTVVVEPKEGALKQAVKNAKSGDIIELANGIYNAAELITIDKTLTIKAKNVQQAKVTFERTALFELVDGGSLKLDGLVLSGENAPDAAGNSLIRSKKWGMLYNYRLVLQNNNINALDINHSFHLFDSGKGAFADEILLHNNQISNVTGDVLRLNKEHEDLGIYNAEYITLHHNQFTSVGGAIATVYRGGTDESTFGPHFSFVKNQLSQVGKGKRNKSKASVFLHGVQVTDIDNNQFSNSATVAIEHTVGEPITQLSTNTFINTEAPKVTELVVKAPHTASLINNRVVSE